ncbi:MAG: hypothetical protein LBJ70_05955 [Holosporales bacterium]|jgi:hypothetical protein|nr:hypothetical protein [Holosporales bacterium]
MQFIFDWAKDPADLTSPWRGDEDPFSLTLTQSEGEFAVARVTLRNPCLQSATLQRAAYARIAYATQEGKTIPLFFGRVLSIPVALRGTLMTVEFIAEPEEAEQQLRALGAKLKEAPYWDPLFVPEHAEDLPHEVLEARTALFAWDRVEGTLRLSDLYRGRQTLTVCSHFQDSLRLHRGPEPWDAVEVTLEAQWTQRAAGCVDIAPIIAQRFPGQMLNTYSGLDFQQSWQSLEHKVQGTGYGILRNSLDEIFPPETGILHLYPRQSPPFFVCKEEEEALSPEHLVQRPLRVFLKRFWFHGQLVLDWNYRQRRQECARFTLRNQHQLRPFQKEKPSQGKIKRLHLKMNPIAPAQDLAPWRGFVRYREDDRVLFGETQYRATRKHRAKGSFLEDQDLWEEEGKVPTALGNPARASFFTTPRGQLAVLHALARARAYLAASSRSFEVSFRGSFEELASVTIEDSICLEDPQLPGGRVWGKVIKTRLVVDGKTQTHWVELRIACGVGFAEHPPSEGYQIGAELYAESTYAEPEAYVQTQAMGIEEIQVEDFSQDVPTSGLTNGAGWDANDLIEGLHIIHTPDEQERFLSDCAFKTPADLLAQLKTHCTSVRLELRDLRPKTLLTHTISVPIVAPWTAPRGVHLSDTP